MLAGVAAPHWRAEAETRLASLASAVPSRPAPEVTRPVAAPAWPAAVQSPRRALALHGLARRSGLEVLLVREQVDAATHLQLVMHGTAAYPALRQFVERALAADPALVLDRLRLHRGETDAAQVNFELQWTLLHSPPAQASTGRIEPAR
ncbi:hypothetical protein D621_14750 [beta proteobacterium AAP51]|nr:hypothetical protein D621_14750 [beta proteobacterium AAP51]